MLINNNVLTFCTMQFFALHKHVKNCVRRSNNCRKDKNVSFFSCINFITNMFSLLCFSLVKYSNTVILMYKEYVKKKNKKNDCTFSGIRFNIWWKIFTIIIINFDKKYKTEFWTFFFYLRAIKTNTHLKYRAFQIYVFWKMQIVKITQ